MGAVLNISEVAQLLKVSPLTVKREIRDGHLEASRVGPGRKLVRIRSEAVEQYLAANLTKSGQEA
jgi:excisionase family DNA binding protein